MNKGMIFEKNFSLSFHSRNVALLISPKLLRKYQLGQVDMAKVELNHYMDIQKVHCVELKYQSIPSKLQQVRLIKATNYLSQLLEVETKFTIKLCKNPIDSLFY